VSWVPVVHTYNPSYSRGTEQEDHGWRLAPANSSLKPILKIPNTWTGGMAQVVEALTSKCEALSSNPPK
jgi:hypothetical protein